MTNKYMTTIKLLQSQKLTVVLFQQRQYKVFSVMSSISTKSTTLRLSVFIMLFIRPEGCINYIEMRKNNETASTHCLIIIFAIKLIQNLILTYFGMECSVRHVS